MNNLNVTNQMPNINCSLLNTNHISKPASVANCSCSMIAPPQPSSAPSSAPPSNFCASVSVDPNPRILPINPHLAMVPLNLRALFPNLMAWINNSNNSCNEYPRSDAFSVRHVDAISVSSDAQGINRDCRCYSDSGEHLDRVSTTRATDNDRPRSESIIAEANILADSMIKPGVNNRKGWILNFLQWRAGKDIDELKEGLENGSNVGMSGADDGFKDSVKPLTKFSHNNEIVVRDTDGSGKEDGDGDGDATVSDVEEFVDYMQTRIESEYKSIATSAMDPNQETVCTVEYDQVVHDRQSIASFLHEVPLLEAKEISKMCMLSNLAYVIPQIQPEQLLKEQDLTFITSSIEKRSGSDIGKQKMRSSPNKSVIISQKETAVAESLGIGQEEPMTDEGGSESMREQYMLQGEQTGCPCEWFICDDETRNVRYVVIQGSDSLASWQTNLAFEPTTFEGLNNVWVHRGIYEAAKGLYNEVLGKLQMQQGWKLCFTGHSLGGSLGMLVAFMAIKRGALKENIVENVVSFGAPYVLCGGNIIMEELCMLTHRFLNVVLDRDIVPRAFSCDYPHHVAHILKHVNGTFRRHPCLNFQRFLYAPIGEMLILLPSDRNGDHELLPEGEDARLYRIRHPAITGKGLYDIDKQMEVMEVQRAFLNAPHPLEIMVKNLRAIVQEHDPRTYAKAMKTVIGCHQFTSIEAKPAIRNHNFDSQWHESQDWQSQTLEAFPIFIGSSFNRSLFFLRNYLTHKHISQYSHFFASQQVKIGMLLILSMTIHLL